MKDKYGHDTTIWMEIQKIYWSNACRWSDAREGMKDLSAVVVGLLGLLVFFVCFVIVVFTVL